MIRHLWVPFFLLALVNCGGSSSGPSSTRTLSDIEKQPCAIDTTPIPARYMPPYTGMVVVHEGDAKFIADNCGSGWGCSKGGDSMAGIRWPACHLYVPRVGVTLSGGRLVTQESVRNLYCHEQAHCNGWPANHPAE